MKIVCASLLIWVAASAFAIADQSIADVQQALKEQGFYYGQITGQKDADTTAAIRRYQIRNGLQINGELNDETLKSIKSVASNTARSAPVTRRTEPPPGAVAPDNSDLRADRAPQDPNSAPVDAFPPDGSDQLPQPRPNVGRPMPSGRGMFAG